MKLNFMVLQGIFLFTLFQGNTQILPLEEALQRSVTNYNKIQSKTHLVAAAKEHTALQKQQYLPDITLSGQQSFGTINVQHGPMYAYGGLASAATSMPLAEQNWNAAFGSLYFINVNWNLFTFGRVKNQVDTGIKKEQTATADLTQEIFQHQVKVGAAYLNLLASQRIKYIQEKNLERARIFYEITDSRAKSGLIPEVDAALAQAEVSNARSLQIKSYDKELEFSKQLAVLLGENFRMYQLDSLYSTTLPRVSSVNGNTIHQHPILEWQQRRVDESIQTEKLLRTYKRPVFSAFGVLQGRGSGFNWNYAQDNTSFSSSYLKGAGIDRGNYLLGLSLSWNVTDLFRFDTKVKAQHYLTSSLQEDLEWYKKELNAQSQMADVQLKNARDNFEETKIQLAAALKAYHQHTTLYKNGLTTLVDYTQSLYSLNRAEIDYEIAQNNVWQALLLLASAQGDLHIFIQPH